MNDDPAAEGEMLTIVTAGSLDELHVRLHPVIGRIRDGGGVPVSISHAHNPFADEHERWSALVVGLHASLLAGS